MIAPRHDLVIIGAGPYGLSLAAHAIHAGLDVAVFGRPMESWKDHMPSGMHLETEGRNCSLDDPGRAWTLAAFCTADGSGASAKHGYRALGWPVPLDLFCTYAEWFQAQAGITVDGRRVVEVGASAGGDTYAVGLADGSEVTASTVAVALGLTAFPFIAPELQSAGEPMVVHSSGAQSPERYRGQEVAVVGGGQSALESAALLAEAGARVTLVVRRPALLWREPARENRSRLAQMRAPRSPLGDGWIGVLFSDGSTLLHALPHSWRRQLEAVCFTPAGSWWLRDRVGAAVAVELATTAVDARPHGDRVRLQLQAADGSRDVREFDCVVAATGYRPDVGVLPFLDDPGSLRLVPETRSPRLSRRFESSQPGLCFTGALAAASFGSGQTFLAGIPAACRGVVRTALARRSPTSPVAGDLRRRDHAVGA